MAGRQPREHAQAVRRSALDIARRHLEVAGKPLSPVMKTAATACELARPRSSGRD